MNYIRTFAWEYTQKVEQPRLKWDSRYNRLKLILAEMKRTSKWLAEQLGKVLTTLSNW